MSIRSLIKSIILVIQIYLILLSSSLILLPSSSAELVLKSISHKSTYIIHFITFSFVYVPLCSKKFNKLIKKF